MYLRRIIRTFGILMLTVLLLNSCGSKNVDELPFVPLDTSTDDMMTEYRVIISRAA